MVLINMHEIVPMVVLDGAHNLLDDKTHCWASLYCVLSWYQVEQGRILDGDLS